MPFIPLEGRWSSVEDSCKCGRTYDQPPLTVDDPNPWSLVGLQVGSQVGGAKLHRSHVRAHLTNRHVMHGWCAWTSRMAP
jgi:hypothetical protein